MDDLTLDYYVLPQNLEKARRQFTQVKPMIEAFEKYFGDYPFKKDGYKLIEVPIFNQYLRHAALPTLEIAIKDGNEAAYRWKADEPRFDMPIRVGTPGAWQTIQPTTEWKPLPAALNAADLQVATDLYFVNVAIGRQTQEASRSSR